MDVGLPMLLIHRTAWDVEDRPVEFTRTDLPGDRFSFIAEHSRRSDDGIGGPGTDNSARQCRRYRWKVSHAVDRAHCWPRREKPTDGTGTQTPTADSPPPARVLVSLTMTCAARRRGMVAWPRIRVPGAHGEATCALPRTGVRGPRGSAGD